MLDDRKLWEDFKADKKNALSLIYKENIKALYSYGKKFTHNNETVKDTIQELFFDLIRTRKTLGSTDNIRYYLFKSLKRKLLRELAGVKLKLDQYEYDEQNDSTIVFSHEEELINKENGIQNKKLVLNALKKISPKQREILYYRFTYDFEYEQICEIMSMKYDSARKMVFRALKSLKEHLQESDI